MRLRFAVATDHDRTLIPKFSFAVAAKYNSSITQRRLRKIREGILRNVKEEEISSFLAARKKIGFDKPEELIEFIEYAYTGRKLSYEAAGKGMIDLLLGLRERELKNAAIECIESISPDVQEYAEWIKREGGRHIIASEGIKQIVESVAKEIGHIDFVIGNALIFENGIFNGKVHLINKWKEAYLIYKKLKLNYKQGVWRRTVAVDDLAINIGEMKCHDFPIAFCPTESDKKIFKGEKLRIKLVEERNFKKVRQAIETYLQYADVMYEEDKVS